MLTIGTLPKAFIGHIGVIQRNAILSWLALETRPQVILFGNEEGTADIARELHLIHVPDVPKNHLDTPYFAPLMQMLEEKATGEFLCFSNCDILLFKDLMPAIGVVAESFPQFLLVGECMNLDVRRHIDFTSDWELPIRAEIREKGKWRGVCADFFVYTRGLFHPPEALVAGRPYYDNWMMWEARRLGIPFINGTSVITSVHQNHFYAAVAGETSGSHKGSEANDNLKILGGNSHVYWTTDATHILTPQGLKLSFNGRFLIRRRIGNIVKKLKYFVIDTLRFLRLR